MHMETPCHHNAWKRVRGFPSDYIKNKHLTIGEMSRMKKVNFEMNVITANSMRRLNPKWSIPTKWKYTQEKMKREIWGSVGFGLIPHWYNFIGAVLAGNCFRHHFYFVPKQFHWGINDTLWKQSLCQSDFQSKKRSGTTLTFFEKIRFLEKNRIQYPRKNSICINLKKWKTWLVNS